MNPYTMLGSVIGTREATSLSTRLAVWHDAMVAHERALRTSKAAQVCDDECPHVEAKGLWREAVAMFGARANELTLLRTRALSSSARRTDDRARRADMPPSDGRERREQLEA